MPENGVINIYGTRAFTSKFMPSVSHKDSIRYDQDRFMIMRIEEMYPHVGRPVPPARAVNDVLLFVSDGSAHMKIGSEAYVAEKYSMFYITAGQIFSFEQYDDSKFTKGFLLTFSEDILTGDLANHELHIKFSLPHHLGSPLIKMEEEIFSFAAQLLERILKENDENGLTRPELIQSYLVAFLCEVRNSQISNENIPNSPQLKLVKDFKELVTRHIKEQQRVSDYAALLHVSPNHLNKVIKKFTSKSPTKWIDETLILEAKVILFQTDMSIAEVSSSLGLFDPSYFSRLFKKYEGITPLSFRNAIRKMI